ncbi:hypothetical protein K0M31_001528 [Melipona bicolor]|uniref:Uncharacterized protein n=1 Tax=Melipona bicolor TaxID=60889 RepID=A0AA40KXS3_9HYME|nr:hypothetical protein K0M31_001528 [Melipona bicolor]
MPMRPLLGPWTTKYCPLDVGANGYEDANIVPCTVVAVLPLLPSLVTIQVDDTGWLLVPTDHLEPGHRKIPVNQLLRSARYSSITSNRSLP